MHGREGRVVDRHDAALQGLPHSPSGAGWLGAGWRCVVDLPLQQPRLFLSFHSLGLHVWLFVFLLLILGPDIEGGHGDGGQSIFGPTFPDESFEVLQDRPGVLVMANAGAPHTNGSQFYVTLAPTPWMDKKRVAFGMVISGMRTFRVIEKMSTCNQRPLDNVTITDCGSFPLARGSRSRRSSASGAGAGTGK